MLTGFVIRGPYLMINVQCYNYPFAHARRSARAPILSDGLYLDIIGCALFGVSCIVSILKSATFS